MQRGEEFIFAFEENAREFLVRAARFGYVDLNSAQPKRKRDSWSIRIPYILYRQHYHELSAIAEDLI